jgi:hypothetical protein
MQQAFGIQSFDGSIIGVGGSREAFEKLIQENPMAGVMSEIIPLEINLEPLTEKGLAIQEEIRRVWEERNISNLHFDKQPGWYKLSADERAQVVLDMINIDSNDPSMRPVDLDY